jgi:aryl-alcohol dehydrogenase-like predicted oxidoreductase
MECRAFGKSELSVSCVGFGAGHIGGDTMAEAEVEHTLHQVLDLGINLIDTARGYGRSEERIGRYLSHRRSEFILSTKIGYGVEGVVDWSPEIIPAGITQALQRLRTDYLDIVHLHSCPASTIQHSDLLHALSREVSSGRVRVAAYSGENDDLAYAIRTGVFGSVQCSVNLFDQRCIRQHLPDAASAGMGVIAKRPLANAAWRFAEKPHGDYAETYWMRMQEMGLDPGDMEWTEFALRFVLSVPGVHTCIIGTANADHLKHNVELAGRGTLSEHAVASIMARFDQCDTGWVGQV